MIINTDVNRSITQFPTTIVFVTDNYDILQHFLNSATQITYRKGYC
jgi:hypothetical protein